jgi:glutamyl-tRNA reductase
MNFIVVGTNHKCSPIELRERISFSKKRLKEVLSLLRKGGILRRAVILSTCNRVEIYAGGEDLEKVRDEIINFISLYHKIDTRVFLPFLYIYENKEAVKHLFAVSCGLDSLVLGERQILGQVKFSFSESKDAGFVNRFLKEIFYSAINFAKIIHQETKISEGKISIGSIAVDFIIEKFGRFSDKKILIIGVGKITELVLKYLKKESPLVVFVSNRTFNKAKRLASQIGAEVARFDTLRKYLQKVDVVITATASPHFIIKRETLEGVVDRRLLILDLAVPRDVDPDVGRLENIELFDLEKLSTIIEKNINRRRVEAEKIREIINYAVEEKWDEFIELEQEPVLSH